MKEIIAPGFVIPSGYTEELAVESVGRGWEKIIRTLFRFLPKGIKVEQVKEKFGTLRFYTNYMDKDYGVLIGWAESASARTCEECGKKGTLDTRYYWVKTLCTQCKRARSRRLGKSS